MAASEINLSALYRNSNLFRELLRAAHISRELVTIKNRRLYVRAASLYYEWVSFCLPPPQVFLFVFVSSYLTIKGAILFTPHYYHQVGVIK
jgi:hypothetical protein